LTYDRVSASLRKIIEDDVDEVVIGSDRWDGWKQSERNGMQRVQRTWQSRKVEDGKKSARVFSLCLSAIAQLFSCLYFVHTLSFLHVKTRHMYLEQHFLYILQCSLILSCPSCRRFTPGLYIRAIGAYIHYDRVRPGGSIPARWIGAKHGLGSLLRGLFASATGDFNTIL
jgi:hypothetical protein